MKNMTLVAELNVKPGTAEIVKITATKITFVGFWANISRDDIKHYNAMNIHPITVKYGLLTMLGIGGGEALIPTNGVITLEIKNHTDKDILVDIDVRNDKTQQAPQN